MKWVKAIFGFLFAIFGLGICIVSWIAGLIIILAGMILLLWAGHDSIKKQTGKSGKKDTTLYLILCICLGFLGVHRFYKHHIGTGILYLLTGGLFLIGWILDTVKGLRGHVLDKVVLKHSHTDKAVSNTFNTDIQTPKTPKPPKSLKLPKVPKVPEVPNFDWICSGFIVSRVIIQNGIVLYFDNEHKKWAAVHRKIVRVYKFSDILNFEVEENGGSIMQSKAGGAIIGGLTFGIVGAMIGSSGKRRIQNTCKSLLLRITVNDFNHPSIVIKYITYEVSKQFGNYKNAVQELGQLTSLLTYMQQNSSETLSDHPQIDSVEEIKKYKSLLDEGIITNQEFELKKKQLLGI